MLGTSPLEIRVEQIHEESNVAGHSVVEGPLEIVRFDHAPRLYQAVAPGGGRPGVDGRIGGKTLGLDSVRCWLTDLRVDDS